MTRKKEAEPSCASAEPSAPGVAERGGKLRRGGLRAAGFLYRMQVLPRPARSTTSKILSRTDQEPGSGRAASEETAALPGPGRGGTAVVGTEGDVSGDGRSLARLGETSGTGELLVAWIAWHVIHDASSQGAGLAARGRSHSGRPSRGRSGLSSVLVAEPRCAARSTDAFSSAGLRRSRLPRGRHTGVFFHFVQSRTKSATESRVVVARGPSSSDVQRPLTPQGGTGDDSATLRI